MMASIRALHLAASHVRAISTGSYMYTTTTTRVGQFTRHSQSMVAASEESPNRYCQGGYHPVRIGDAFNHDRYKVINKLGYGASSTVWLAYDNNAKKHFALKILTSDSFGKAENTFELDVLKRIATGDASKPGKIHIARFLDHFRHRGPNGDHVCLVFKAMGPDIVEFRRLFPQSRIPLPILRKVVRQLLLALSYLHDACGVIHTGPSTVVSYVQRIARRFAWPLLLTLTLDIKPRSILVETPEINQMFEEAPSEVFKPDQSSIDPENDYYIRSTQVSSAEEDLASAPELSVRLADFGTAEGQLLFDGTWAANDGYTPEAHLAQMEAFFGDMPSRLLDRSVDRGRYYDSRGNLLRPSTFARRTLEECSRNPELVGPERGDFFDLVQSMVRLDPEERPEAKDLLKSPWLAR